jgi:hypothetical protein
MSRTDELKSNIASLLYYFQNEEGECSCNGNGGLTKDVFFHLASWYDITKNISLTSSELRKEYSFTPEFFVTPIGFDIEQFIDTLRLEVCGHCSGYYIANHDRFNSDMSRDINKYYSSCSTILDICSNNTFLHYDFPLVDFRFLIGLVKLRLYQIYLFRILNRNHSTEYVCNLFVSFRDAFIHQDNFNVDNYIAFMEHINVIDGNNETITLLANKISKDLSKEYILKSNYINKMNEIIVLLNENNPNANDEIIRRIDRLLFSRR